MAYSRQKVDDFVKEAEASLSDNELLHLWSSMLLYATSDRHPPILFGEMAAWLWNRWLTLDPWERANALQGVNELTVRIGCHSFKALVAQARLEDEKCKNDS